MTRRSDTRRIAEVQAGVAALDRRLAAEERERQARHARRVINGTASKPRPTCRCTAYPWPHRPGGGSCRGPDAEPSAVWEGTAGRHPGTFGRVSGGSSATRRRLLRRYGWHPVRDRQRIRRWLPKLYAAWSRRHGLPWVYQAMGGYVPAMRVTEHGVPPGVEPYTAAGLMDVLMRGTRRRWTAPTSPALLRRAGQR